MWRAPLVALAALVASVLLVSAVQLTDRHSSSLRAQPHEEGGTRWSTGDALARQAQAGHAPHDPEPSHLQLRDFCRPLGSITTPESPSSSSSFLSGGAAAVSTFNLVVPAAGNTTGNVPPCPFWSAFSYPHLRPPVPVLPVCIHPPDTDGGVSAFIHARGGFMTGRQLTSLLAASPCTPSAPYFLDVGANVGSFGLLAAALGGCYVVAFEPLQDNVDRLLASAAALGLGGGGAGGGRLVVFRNAVAGAPGTSHMEASMGNSGGNRLQSWNVPSTSEASESAPVPTTPVDVVTLASLLAPSPAQADAFSPELRGWLASLPVPLTPASVGGLKVDAEGFDAQVLAGAGAGVADAVPWLYLEFEPQDVVAVAGCDPGALLRRLWGHQRASAPEDAGGGVEAAYPYERIVLDAWAMRPVPPPCAPSTDRRLRALASFGSAPAPEGDDAWPPEMDELLVVRTDAPFLRPLLEALAALRNNTADNVLGPLRAPCDDDGGA